MAITPKGLLIDITRCIGCNACSERCKEVNDLPGDVAGELDSENYTCLYDKVSAAGTYASGPSICR